MPPRAAPPRTRHPPFPIPHCHVVTRPPPHAAALVGRVVSLDVLSLDGSMARWLAMPQLVPSVRVRQIRFEPTRPGPWKLESRDATAQVFCVLDTPLSFEPHRRQCAVEMALLHLLSRAIGVPIAELLAVAAPPTQGTPSPKWFQHGPSGS